MKYFKGDAVHIKKTALKEDGFPVYRQSSLKNYYTCPHMFALSMSLPEEEVSKLIESRLTKMGLLFEGYALGFKTPEENIKGIGPDVKKRLKNAAEFLRNYPLKEVIQFGNGTTLGEFFKGGTAYYDQMVVGENLALSGEADFFHPEFGFFDLKHTEDIDNAGWRQGASRFERLQAIAYPFLSYINDGIIHPFYYVIVESKYDTPVIRTNKYKPTHEDFEWLIEQLNIIYNDPFYHPVPGEYDANCLRQRYGLSRARCKFMGHCEHGRSLLGGFHEMEFSKVEVKG